MTSNLQKRRRVLNAGSGPLGRALPLPFNPDDWQEVRLDVDASVAPDIVASLTAMGDAVADASFDAVWSSHSIEHINGFEVMDALREFRRALKPGGFAIVTCPDVEAVAADILEYGLDHVAYVSPAGPITLHDILYGHSQSIRRGETAMAHRTGLTARRLGELALDAGFAEVAVGCGPDYDLWGILTLADTDQVGLARELAVSPAAFVFAQGPS